MYWRRVMWSVGAKTSSVSLVMERLKTARAVPVSGIKSATSLTAGGYGFACASLMNGTVECWGRYSLTPVPVGGVTDAVAVSGGEEFACALRSTGGVDCWQDSGSLAAEHVAGITDATAIAASAAKHVIRL